MKKLFAMSFVGALGMISTISCQAATPEQACTVWANMASSMAQGRDSGVPLKDQLRKVEAMRGMSGITPSNVGYAHNLAILVYKDFPKKSPDDLAVLIHTSCLIQNSK